VSGLVLLRLLYLEKLSNEFNLIMFYMTLGLLIFDCCFSLFVFDNLYDPTLSWIFIIAVFASIFAYLLSALLGYSVFYLLTYKVNLQWWDYKTKEFKLLLVLVIAILGGCLWSGIVEFYSRGKAHDVAKEHSVLSLFSLCSKVSLSVCNLVFYVISEYRLNTVYQGSLQIKQTVHKLRLYPLLQLICIAPLFISGLQNNFKVLEIYALDSGSNIFYGFAFSYVILYLDLFFMLIVYILLNENSIKTLQSRSFWCLFQKSEPLSLFDNTVNDGVSSFVPETYRDTSASELSDMDSSNLTSAL
jgi:hypothetical protein